MEFDRSEVAFSHLDDRALKRARLLFTVIAFRPLAIIAPKITRIMLKLHFPILSIIKRTMFAHFCGGESIDETRSTVVGLVRRGIGAILDYSVEGAGDSASFDHTTNEILATIDEAKGSKALPFTVFKVTGVASVELLERMQSQSQLSDEELVEFDKVKARVNRICERAYSSKVNIFIDAEESWIQDVIDSITEEMIVKYNHAEAFIFSTLQMYRTDRMEYLMKLKALAEEKKVKLGLKIVRGAYMEKERLRAETHHEMSPIHETQYATDRDYNLALEYCMQHRDIFSICVGTHNEYSTRKMLSLMETYGIEKNDHRYYFAQLLGMSDHISNALAAEGYNVAKYVPYGPIAEVLPYLFRRAEENTSIAGQSSRELRLLNREYLRRKLN